MVRQMQNTVGVHVEGKGYRTPGAVWPWHWIGDHGLSSSAGKRMRVSTGAYACMPHDTIRAPHSSGAWRKSSTSTQPLLMRITEGRSTPPNWRGNCGAQH